MIHPITGEDRYPNTEEWMRAYDKLPDYIKQAIYNYGRCGVPEDTPAVPLAWDVITYNTVINSLLTEQNRLGGSEGGDGGEGGGD